MKKGAPKIEDENLKLSKKKHIFISPKMEADIDAACKKLNWKYSQYFREAIREKLERDKKKKTN